jgi:opacity protein-like surface antigen
VFGIALVVMIGAAGQAQAQEDFSRPGFYVGTGLALGVEAWDDNGLLAMEVPIGVDTWLGYRATPNLAVEVEIEYLNGFDPLVDPMDESQERISMDALTATGNLKAYLPVDRFQPFVLVGIGMTTYWISSFSETAFSMRFGGGADYYLTENIALGMKATFVLMTGNLDGADYVSFTWGAQYRF